MKAPANMHDLIDVRFELRQTPHMARHRITVSDADGVVCWLTGGPSPESMQFSSGDIVNFTASIAAHGDSRSKSRPSKEWQLQADRDGSAVLRLGPSGHFWASHGLEIHVQGARLRRAPRS